MVLQNKAKARFMSSVLKRIDKSQNLKNRTLLDVNANSLKSNSP